MRKGWAFTVALVFGLVALAACARWPWEKEKLTLDQVPAAVRATIEKEAKGAEIKEIEKEDEDGKLVYEAEFVRDGKETEIKVDPAGKLLSTEVELTLAEVPAAVKATILKEAKGAAIKEVEKETKDGKTAFEAEFVVDGKEVEIMVDPAGKLLSREVEDEEDDEKDD